MLRSKPLFPIVQQPVLLVDDEEQVLNAFKRILRLDKITNVKTISDSQKVLSFLELEEVDVILLDLLMPRVSGKKLLSDIKELYPDIPVIIVTGVNDLKTVVECIQMGAYNYLTKPVEPERLIQTVRNALAYRILKRENNSLKQKIYLEKLENPNAFTPIITQNPAMFSLFQYMENISKTSHPVLITGETGVGKELIAKILHEISQRQGPFIPVNIAGVDDSLFSDTLFGHKKGSFTGALEDREGLIKKANNGTLFLDEIGDLLPVSQIKLLRLLQEKEYTPLGIDIPECSNARVILATNQDLRSLQKDGKFRTDLYYRLLSHQIHIPPLHQRLDDLPLLVDFFLKESAKELGKKVPAYPHELITLLSTYTFPGNIRELKSMVFNAMSNHSKGMLCLESFKAWMDQNATLPHNKSQNQNTPSVLNLGFDRFPTIKEITQIIISEAMKRAKGKQSIASGLLGITRQSLNERLKRSGL